MQHNYEFRKSDREYRRTKRKNDKEENETMQRECEEMEDELLRNTQECIAHKNNYHESYINYFRCLMTVFGVFSKSKLFARPPSLHPHDAWCISSMRSGHFTINYASPQLLKLLKYSEMSVMCGLAIFHLRHAFPQVCILLTCFSDHFQDDEFHADTDVIGNNGCTTRSLVWVKAFTMTNSDLRMYYVQMEQLLQV